MMVIGHLDSRNNLPDLTAVAVRLVVFFSFACMSKISFPVVFHRPFLCRELTDFNMIAHHFIECCQVSSVSVKKVIIMSSEFTL